MELAVHCSNLTWPGGPRALAATLAEVARTADEGGISTLTLMDHYFQMEALGGPAEPMLEGYTTLGFLAAHTARVELGLLVTGVTYRHPGLLAKIVSTLDVLSGGRAMLGLGAAWYEREHAGLGVRFPGTRERLERVEETLQICRQMWSDDNGPWSGRHYELAETVCVPAPLRPGGPRVLVGGGGERRTLRLVAEYAESCNLFDLGPEQVAHKLRVLDEHCAAVGRDPGEVRRTVLVNGDPLADVDGLLRQAEAYAALGVGQIWVRPRADDPVGSVEALCHRVLPRLADVG
jgi:F420-dependent oxidoreductase-like protein